MQNDRRITITTGASRKSVSWQSQTMLLSELWERLRSPARSSETLGQYLALPKSQQDDLKDVGGFIGGSLNGPRRKAEAVAGRDLVTLDLDSIPSGGTQPVAQRVAALGCGYCIYSTRKHMPSAPRLRIILPLDRTVTADEYEPIARRMADYIGMEYADPTTFEASRLMYWPSCCSDAEFIYYTDDKPLLSADGLLATYTDWRDITSWPVCASAPSPQRLAARQGDPLEKKGVVGAFCRVYSIEDAMAKFLPGVYEPLDGMPGRFTFLGGSTAGGAVLYDDGKFLYSHHATDPCSNRLVNAFDLVRLHRFGARDDEATPGTPTVKLPSYQAMTELAREDPAVAGALMDERWQAAQDAFTPATEEDDGAWRKLLKVNSQGAPEKSMNNLRTALLNDPNLKGKIRLNLFSSRIDAVGELPWKRPTSTAEWSDEDLAQLRLYFEAFFGKVPKQDLIDTVAAVASDQAYHPVRDYLEGLQWDGQERLDRLLIDYLGAADDDYTRAVTRKAFVAAVSRVMRPGCKYDTMLVLVGGQGRYKSTILAKMGGEYFSDSLRTFGDKDSMETLQGTWINEIAEMQAMAKADVEAVKMFLSKTTDYYRAAYARFTGARARQCVFFGTTNSRECLTDITGARRFWVVDIDMIKRTKDVFADLDPERDQLWAEAVMRWRMGESLYLPQELETVAQEIQEGHRQRHPWEGMISDFLDEAVPTDWRRWQLRERQAWRDGSYVQKEEQPIETGPRQTICALEIWVEMLGEQRGRLTRSISKEINGILERAPGWKPVGVRLAGEPYGKQRLFRREEAEA